MDNDLEQTRGTTVPGQRPSRRDCNQSVKRSNRALLQRKPDTDTYRSARNL